jgi:hypothetical protein
MITGIVIPIFQEHADLEIHIQLQGQFKAIITNFQRFDVQVHVSWDREVQSTYGQRKHLDRCGSSAVD